MKGNVEKDYKIVLSPVEFIIYLLVPFCFWIKVFSL